MCLLTGVAEVSAFAARPGEFTSVGTYEIPTPTHLIREGKDWEGQRFFLGKGSFPRSAELLNSSLIRG